MGLMKLLLLQRIRKITPQLKNNISLSHAQNIREQQCKLTMRKVFHQIMHTIVQNGMRRKCKLR